MWSENSTSCENQHVIIHLTQVQMSDKMFCGLGLGESGIKITIAVRTVLKNYTYL